MKWRRLNANNKYCIIIYDKKTKPTIAVNGWKWEFEDIPKETIQDPEFRCCNDGTYWVKALDKNNKVLWHEVRPLFDTRNPFWVAEQKPRAGCGPLDIIIAIFMAGYCNFLVVAIYAAYQG